MRVVTISTFPSKNEGSSHSRGRADQPVAPCGLEVIPNHTTECWPTRRSMQPGSYSQPHCQPDRPEGPMKPALEGHLLVKLFATSSPKLTHQKVERWSAFNHRSWEGEAHQASGVDRDTRMVWYQGKISAGKVLGAMKDRGHFLLHLEASAKAALVWRRPKPSWIIMSEDAEVVGRSPPWVCFERTATVTRLLITWNIRWKYFFGCLFIVVCPVWLYSFAVRPRATLMVWDWSWIVEWPCHNFDCISWRILA